jgi:hypothetical protein
MTLATIKPELVSEVLALKQGDHLCLIYDNDPAEQMPAILPFINQGLKNGEQRVYVADDMTLDDLRDALEGDGVEVRGEAAKGALQLWTRPERRQPGPLDSALKAAQVRGLVDRALATSCLRSPGL